LDNEDTAYFIKPGDGDGPPDYQFQLQFLSTLYDGRIKDARKVFDRLIFSGWHNCDERAPTLFKLFVLRLHRWLNGMGHPPELVGTVVSQDAYESSMQQGSAFRPRLFWKVLSDFEVLPGVLDTCAFVRCFQLYFLIADPCISSWS
jgi:hypothetical protein